MHGGAAIKSAFAVLALILGVFETAALADEVGGECLIAGEIVVLDSVTYNCVKVDTILKLIVNPLRTRKSEIFALVNKVRSDSGLNSLSECVPLNQAARLHSKDMNVRDFFDHTNPDGKSPTDRIRSAGYFGSTRPIWTGENIAAGFADAASVMTAWMNSPGHRANILNAKFTHLGVGIVAIRTDSKYRGYIWTQEFGANGTC